MARLWDEIDLHVAWMLLLLLPGSFLSRWLLIAALLLPQGRILVRAFVDCPCFRLRPWWYMIGNDLLVVGAVCAFFGLDPLLHGL
jgi:hypothetical protein